MQWPQTDRKGANYLNLVRRAPYYTTGVMRQTKKKKKKKKKKNKMTQMKEQIKAPKIYIIHRQRDSQHIRCTVQNTGNQDGHRIA